MAPRRQQLSLALETDRATTTATSMPNEEAIVQALADLILEAYGQETTRMPSPPPAEPNDER